MRYPAAMAMHGPSLAALLGIISLGEAAAPAAQPAVHRGSDLRSTATRSEGGAIAHATVTARIVREVARVGRGLGPPAPHMVARAMSVSAADGRTVPALIYDFE